MTTATAPLFSKFLLLTHPHTSNSETLLLFLLFKQLHNNFSKYYQIKKFSLYEQRQ